MRKDRVCMGSYASRANVSGKSFDSVSFSCSVLFFLFFPRRGLII